MSRGHDFKITIPASRFNGFTKVITQFNKRIDGLNKTLKKKKYDRVWRFVDSENVQAGTVNVTIEIKDRAKTLYQELVAKVDSFVQHVNAIEEESKAKVHTGTAPGVWIPCVSEEHAKKVAAGLNALQGHGSAVVRFL